MASQEDPDAPLALAVTALFLFTAYGVRFYRSPDVPMAIQLLIGVSWFLGFAGVLLLPFDLGDVQTYGRSVYWVADCWSFIYWTTFILAWAVFPLLSGFLDSGYFTYKDRIKDAIHEQIRWGLVALGGLLAFTIYLLAQRYTLAKIEGFLIALGNTYGLMIIVVLLGNGLVEVPRRLWMYSDPDRELQRLYFRSSRIDSDIHDAVYSLDDIEAEVALIKERLRMEGTGGESPSVIEEAMTAIQETRDSFRHRPDGMAPSMIPRRREGANAESEVVTLAKLAALHARLKTAQLRVHAQKLQWESIVRDVEVMEQVVAGTLPLPDGVQPELDSSICSRIGACYANLVEWFIWHWKVSWSPPILRAMSVVCWILTVGCLWSEILLSSPVPLSPFGALVSLVGESSPFVVEAATFLPLLYLSICTYRSLFKFKLFGDFSLKGPHQTLTRPLLVNAQFLVRLQFPLAYHFTLLLRSPASRRTAFHDLMSDMAVVPILGTQFNIFAPLVIMVLAMFTFFNGYARLLNMVGFQHEDCLSGSDQQEMIAEGRALARRRRNQRVTSSAPSPLTNVAMSKMASSAVPGGHYRQLR